MGGIWENLGAAKRSQAGLEERFRACIGVYIRQQTVAAPFLDSLVRFNCTNETLGWKVPLRAIEQGDEAWTLRALEAADSAHAAAWEVFQVGRGGGVRGDKRMAAMRAEWLGAMKLWDDARGKAIHYWASMTISNGEAGETGLIAMIALLNARWPRKR